MSILDIIYKEKYINTSKIAFSTVSLAIDLHVIFAQLICRSNLNKIQYSIRIQDLDFQITDNVSEIW